MEIWKDIEGYEGLYQVSNTGKVKSIVMSMGRRVRELTQMKRSNHYEGLCVHLYNNDKKMKTYPIHRLVAQAFIPNPNNLPNVCHKDDNPKNNKVSNLFWGTTQDNVKDRQSKGRQARGESSAPGKLKNDQVLTILEEYTGKRGELERFAERFNVTRQAVWHIVHKKTWKHI